MRQGHDPIVVPRGIRQTQKLEHGGIDEEPPAETAQHHVSWITQGKQNARVRKQLRDHRQRQRVQRQFVENELARKVVLQCSRTPRQYSRRWASASDGDRFAR